MQTSFQWQWLLVTDRKGGMTARGNDHSLHFHPPIDALTPLQLLSPRCLIQTGHPHHGPRVPRLRRAWPKRHTSHAGLPASPAVVFGHGNVGCNRPQHFAKPPVRRSVLPIRLVWLPAGAAAGQAACKKILQVGRQAGGQAGRQAYKSLRGIV